MTDEEPMLVDVGKLGDVNERAQRGAENATRDLNRMADVDAEVTVTKINLISLDHLNRRFAGDDHVVVSIGLGDHLEGELVTVFDRESAGRIAAELVGEAATEGPLDEMDESALKEIVNIMTSGFVDGWANDVDAAIEMTPPEIEVKGRDEDVFDDRFAPGSGESDQVLHLRSEVGTARGTVGFGFYMFLDRSSLNDVIGSEGGTEVLNLDRLTMMKEVAQRSSDRIAGDIEQMTAIPAGVKITHLDFIPVQDLARQETDDTAAGIVVTFDEDPSGFIVILFDEPTADRVTSSLIPDESDGDLDGFSEDGRSALEELGNIIASGFVDGWADALGHTIDISTPEFVHDMRQSVLTDATVQLAGSQQFILCFRTKIDALDREFECDIYNIVETGGLYGDT